ncbi:MAG: hypothetical protein K0Q95_202 [Bacteroidota bacterium]|jgi:hypothetical protein|nr:hypothetical protein [Bacteroidota bacterium]
MLPEETKQAEMCFYNGNGTLIKRVELTQKGTGQLNIFRE